MSKFAVVAFPDEGSASAAVHSLQELHQDGIALVYGAALVQRDERGSLSVKQRRGEVPLGLGGGPLVDALLGRVEREIARGTFAVVAELSEERGTPIDAPMDALGGKVVREWREDWLHDVLAEAGNVRTELVARGAERVAAEADRMSSKLAEVLEGERDKLERAVEELRERIRYAKQEVSAQMEAIGEQVARASPEVASRVSRRIATLRASLRQCDEKLERACDLAREAVRADTRMKARSPFPGAMRACVGPRPAPLARLDRSPGSRPRRAVP